jgi:GT2 family glycosyltransferase
MATLGSRVTAVVLTHDARSALQRCLCGLDGQRRSVDGLIVVDNASLERVDDLVASRPCSRIVRSAENLGPAGGYAIGIGAFLEGADDYAWLMDDDCLPTAEALEAQLADVDQARVVMATTLDADTGDVMNTHGWSGVLVPRRVIAAVGLPDASLFWWTEDTEYLQWRIPRAGFNVRRCERAHVLVSRSRAAPGKPAWKYYYEARNQVHYRLHTQRLPKDERPPRHLKWRVRVWRAGRSVCKLALLSVFRERRGRARKLAMVALGTADGLRGRLGITIRTDDSHRPDIGPTIEGASP